MSVVSSRLLIAATLMGAVAVGGCTKLRAHNGYVIDVDLANSIRPGVDNRESVLATLGRPTLTSEFNTGDWYYVSRDSRYLAYNRPKPVSQNVIHVSFDQNGTVTDVNRTGMEQVASINPSDNKTPTLGRERGFFESIFGNIGSVTPGGMAGPGAPGGGPGR